MKPIGFFALIALFIALFMLNGCASVESKPDIKPATTYEWHGIALCGNLLILEARGSDGTVVEWVGKEAWHAAIAAAEEFPESEVNVWNLEQIYPPLDQMCGVHT